jgi:hypothetical protein
VQDPKRQSSSRDFKSLLTHDCTVAVKPQVPIMMKKKATALPLKAFKVITDLAKIFGKSLWWVDRLFINYCTEDRENELMLG